MAPRGGSAVLVVSEVDKHRDEGRKQREKNLPSSLFWGNFDQTFKRAKMTLEYWIVYFDDLAVWF